MRNHSLRQLAPVSSALARLAALGPRLSAVEADELTLLRDQIHALEQQLLVLERKQEIKDEAAATTAPTTPKITINDKGFTFASADGAIPLYASPASSARAATAYGLGLNWYLAKAALLKFDYFQTRFGFAPGAPAESANSLLRQNEQVFITRLQLAF